jgi:hypothetical protein
MKVSFLQNYKYFLYSSFAEEGREFLVKKTFSPEVEKIKSDFEQNFHKKSLQEKIVYIRETLQTIESINSQDTITLNIEKLILKQLIQGVFKSGVTLS